MIEKIKAFLQIVLDIDENQVDQPKIKRLAKYLNNGSNYPLHRTFVEYIQDSGVEIVNVVENDNDAYGARVQYTEGKEIHEIYLVQPMYDNYKIDNDKVTFWNTTNALRAVVQL